MNSILLRRFGALGDVLLAAAIAPALKKKHNCKIVFDTMCPEILLNNPYIDELGSDAETCYDLSYENQPHVNILTAYSNLANVSINDCELFLQTEEIKTPKKYVAIHAGQSNWAGRDWHGFKEIASKLMSVGHNVVAVGTFSDGRIPCSLDLRGKTNIKQLAYVIKNAKLFVGGDSFPMHVCEVFSTPGIVFFGSTDPKIILTRNCIIPVMAKDLCCLGCHHWEPAPCYCTNVCRFKAHRCVYGVTVDQFWKVISEIFRNN
jgi:ADP-heptose:LPS heptosyltransferase